MQQSPKWLFQENETKPDRDRLEAYINSLAEGFIAVSEEGQIEMSNAVALSLLDSHQLAGKKLAVAVKLVDKSDQPVDILSLYKTQKTAMVSQDYSLKKSDGTVERLHLSLSPIISQKTRYSGGYVILIRLVS